MALVNELQIGDVVRFMETDGQYVEGKVIGFTGSGASARVDWFDGYEPTFVRIAALEKA